MHETISAAEANRNFSKVLRGVRNGRSYLVTNHGQPIARIVPAGGLDLANGGAKDALLTRLERQPATDIGHWTREELYEEKP